ncbi:AAA family ATPase [Pectobacterium parvum]|uniref:AAA family ATPase n=1 Tax=Pectobacterium parvum TaxID=2778550 RepID=A0AAP9IHK1_9GAMM|nr:MULTISPECIES: AAA family ATPase [Pectobacterium]GKW42392.1 ATPase AAA [Pectobacterium carotovorum subsp. carotovorum]KFX13383.1 ATPase AAA [Pectobacterium parvum]KHS95941.1 ATPase AAA [Pectobacterium parvum]MCU1802014.1 ATP-binding cassette domain-containing protein [Pectobacterium parvum]QHQ24697.1 AAA family ATPase [Pectobacterium parvum]
MISTQYVSRIALAHEKVNSFEVYPFSIPSICSLDKLDLHPKVTFFIGENGSGKSTLLEAIAVSMGFNPEGGTRNFNFGTRISHSRLSHFLRVAKGIKKPKNGFFLRAESFFNVATEIERLDSEPSFGPPVINSYGGHSLHEQSHGESFMALLLNRFGKEGIYLLDEPEAALSPSKQLAALARMHDLIREGSQFVIATHSPILMAYPDATIFQFGEDGIQQVAYEETEHYQITRAFLNNPERMLRELMAE